MFCSEDVAKVVDDGVDRPGGLRNDLGSFNYILGHTKELPERVADELRTSCGGCAEGIIRRNNGVSWMA